MHLGILLASCAKLNSAVQIFPHSRGHPHSGDFGRNPMKDEHHHGGVLFIGAVLKRRFEFAGQLIGLYGGKVRYVDAVA